MDVPIPPAPEFVVSMRDNGATRPHREQRHGVVPRRLPGVGAELGRVDPVDAASHASLAVEVLARHEMVEAEVNRQQGGVAIDHPINPGGVRSEGAHRELRWSSRRCFTTHPANAAATAPSAIKNTATT